MGTIADGWLAFLRASAGVSKGSTADLFQAFLNKYPNGLSSGLAVDTALTSSFASVFKPNTAYAAGAIVLNPDRRAVSANVAFTSGAAYVATDWMTRFIEFSGNGFIYSRADGRGLGLDNVVNTSVPKMTLDSVNGRIYLNSASEANYDPANIDGTLVAVGRSTTAAILGVGSTAGSGGLGVLHIETRLATDVPALIKGAPAQSGDLTQWKDSFNTTVAAISATGGLAITPVTTTVAPAAGGAGALPATPAGYATITIAGVARKIAYY